MFWRASTFDWPTRKCRIWRMPHGGDFFFFISGFLKWALGGRSKRGMGKACAYKKLLIDRFASRFTFANQLKVYFCAWLNVVRIKSIFWQALVVQNEKLSSFNEREIVFWEVTEFSDIFSLCRAYHEFPTILYQYSKRFSLLDMLQVSSVQYTGFLWKHLKLKIIFRGYNFIYANRSSLWKQIAKYVVKIKSFLLSSFNSRG